MGKFRGFGHEYFLYYEQIQFAQGADDMLRIWVSLYIILSHQPEGFQFAIQCGIIHLWNFIPHMQGELGMIKLFIHAMDLRFGDIEIAGSLMRLATHICRTLDVVLSPQWIDPYPATSDITCDHSEVSNQHDGVCAL